MYKNIRKSQFDGLSVLYTGRRGMLIPMILIGMFIFIMFFFTLMKWNSSNRRMNYQDVWGKKALYLAKGGTQLALLKVSMMPTECYDALSISQLKNPYFSFKIAAERIAAGKKPVTQIGRASWRERV